MAHWQLDDAALARLSRACSRLLSLPALVAVGVWFGTSLNGPPVANQPSQARQPMVYQATPAIGPPIRLEPQAR